MQQRGNVAGKDGSVGEEAGARANRRPSAEEAWSSCPAWKNWVGVSERTCEAPAGLWPGLQGSLTSLLTSNDQNTHEAVIKAVEV